MIDKTTLEKDWGKDFFIFSNNSTIVRRLEIKKDGKSTFGRFHKHLFKYNRFFVEKGLLKVLVTKNNIEKEYIIGDGQDYRKVDIFPGMKHRFEALEDSIVYEIYWVFCSNEDIIRD